MTSERSNFANRNNSMSSTGPRTSEGKARSKQNARKHGLSIIYPNSQLGVETERLAVLIAGDYGDNIGILSAARTVAEAQIYLQRVQSYKTAMLRTAAADRLSRVEVGQKLLGELSPVIFVQLERIDRYEARALSRRKVALRRFSELIEQN